MVKVKNLMLILFILFFVDRSFADDGYRLWLTFDKVPETVQKNIHERLKGMYILGDSPTMAVVQKELMQDLDEMLGKPVPVVEELTDGILVVGKAGSSDVLKNKSLEFS